MVRFFRTLRRKLIDEQKTRHYIYYALGEIILVMVGILLALQVNNWNEQRKVIATEKVILKSAIESMRQDSLLLVTALDELNKIDQLHEQVFMHANGQLAAEDIGNLMYLRRSLLYNPITKNNHPDLANELIRQDMKQEIRSYYKMMDDVMYVVSNFNSFMEENVRPKFIEARVNKFGFQFLQTDEIPNNNNRFLSGKTTINRNALIDYLENEDFQNLLVEVGTKYTVSENSLQSLQDENAELIAKLLGYSKER